MNLKYLRALLLKRFNLPKESSLKKVLRSFTIAEKAVYYFFVTIFICSSILLLWKVNSSYLVEVPTQGGTLSEGIVGNPRFINPVLAISEADRNLTSLIYSGLVSIDPEGNIENDLAEDISISEDRLTYTVTLKDGAHFHDETPVSADDVVFTIDKILDPMVKSPRRGNWDGVVVEKVDAMTLTFTLKQAYTPFIYNLTTGILPKNIWKNVTDDEFSFTQFNTLPVGSGPYRVERVERNSGGIPDYYRLVATRDADGREPYIENLVFKFYSSEEDLIDAYNKHEVESIGGISPERISELRDNGAEILSPPLPRVFAVFFNQNQAKVLADKEVRRALNLASPKEAIVNEVLGGYATAIDGPLPAGIYPWVVEEKTPYEERFLKAQEILSEAGWSTNEETGLLEKKSKSDTVNLSFSISTGDAPELQQVANALAESWGELGAEINILVYETGDLNQNIIRPRNFDALLFGEVVGRNTDLYPFWHSSQRTDPGLNIVQYTNSQADKFLEEARSAADFAIIEENYRKFSQEIESDLPAVFLYTPSFLYIVPEKIKALEIGSLTVSQDKFLGIKDWFIETDKVWKVFLN